MYEAPTSYQDTEITHSSLQEDAVLATTKKNEFWNSTQYIRSMFSVFFNNQKLHICWYYCYAGLQNPKWSNLSCDYNYRENGSCNITRDSMF